VSTGDNTRQSLRFPPELVRTWKQAEPWITKILALVVVLYPLWYGLIERPPSESQVPITLRLTAFSIIIPTGIGLWYYQKLSLSFRILLLFMLSAWTVEMLTVQQSAQRIQGYVYFQIYTFIEFGSLMLIFSMWQSKPRMQRVLIFTVVIVTLVLLVLKIYRSENGETFDTLASTIESLVLVAAALITLISLTSENITFVFSNPRFWVVSAVLIYFAGTVIVFSLVNWVLTVQPVVWITVHSALNGVSNLLYAYAFLCQYLYTRSSDSSH
jgi:hypothetical protein